MGETTAIEWTDSTLNSYCGCTRALLPDGTPHPGCFNCYAENGIARKFGGVIWGPVAEGGTRRVYTGFAEKARELARKAGKTGVPRNVFGDSLSDILEPDASPEGLLALYSAIRDTRRWLRWILLTKRPWMWANIPEDCRDAIWLLTSVSDQNSADQLVPRLLEAEGFAGLGLSAEPLVGALRLDDMPDGQGGTLKPLVGLRWTPGHGWSGRGPAGLYPKPTRRLSWVIVGGESGTSARPYRFAWPRALIQQCSAAGTAVFHKQSGERIAIPYYGESDRLRDRILDGPHEIVVDGAVWDLDVGQPPPDAELHYRPRQKKGGDMSEWPADVRVREFPEGLRRAA